MMCNSWIAVSIETGKPVLETWNTQVAARIDREKYEVLTALEWLHRLNREVKEPVCSPAGNLPAHQKQMIAER